MPNITELPIEILSVIFCNLKVCDLRNVMLTCKFLNATMINDNILWKIMRRKYFTIGFPNIPIDRQIQKHSPYNICRISYNWRQGIYRYKSIIRHHTNYLPWISLQGDRFILSVGSALISYSRDKRNIPTLEEKIWSVECPKLPLIGMLNNDITRFVVKKDYIVCGNRNGSIAVYRNREYRKRLNDENVARKKYPYPQLRMENPNLEYHMKYCHLQGDVEVSSVDFTMSTSEIEIIFSASRDCRTVKTWKKSRNSDFYDQCSELIDNLSLSDRTNSNTNNNYEDKSRFRCVGEVNICESGLGVRCVQLNQYEDLLVCGLNGNNRPLLIDVETGQIVLNPLQHYKSQYATMDVHWIKENLIAFVTHSGELGCVDVRSGEMVYKVDEPFRSPFYCVKSDGARALMAGSAHCSRCVLFDMRDNSGHVQLYFMQNQSSPIYSLGFDSSVLVAAADRSVAALDFSVRSYNIRPRNYPERFFLNF